MTPFGLRKLAKGALQRALGIQESPSDTTAPNWQNRTPEPAPVVTPAPPVVVAPAPAEVAPPKAEPEEAAKVPLVHESTATAADDVVGAALTMAAVQDIFDDMVRPALQADGGDITLLKIEDMDVHVQLTGACTSCASSTVTMRAGVEALLREEFPSMRELIEINGVGDAEA
jgi:Fe-S cluster biogenesis protein NfuA